jgi:glycerol-3-phosphate dehydrogenase
MQGNQFGLSVHNREDILRHAEEKHWDLIVIGGGITGAGILLDARLRGIDVLLVEQNDFASGTSSKSTKLIHGGLRYLKQLDFALVREVGRERSLLHYNAPHLVEPAPMMLPFFKKGSLGKATAKLGLWLYETLAGVKMGERFKTYSALETKEMEPLLRDGELLGSAVYTEYQTNDARLTLGVLKTAVQEGAFALNYAGVSTFIKENGKICGVNVHDTLSGKDFCMKASVIVNAAGPWVDALREKDTAVAGKRLHLTKGVHITVNHSDFPIRQPVYFDSSDGRMIFAIPRENYVYIGTTDTNYGGSLSNITLEKQDIAYLIQAWNSTFRGKGMQESDIVSGWAGLRPLIHQDGKKPTELSRKDEIWESGSGLISLAGGKLTGYRVMAEKACNKVIERLNQSGTGAFKPCTTATKILLGGDFQGFNGWREYAAVQYGEAKEIGASAELIGQWVKLFGRETEKIIDLAFTIWPEIDAKSEVLTRALIRYLRENEMLHTPLDYYERRIAKLGFDIRWCYADFERNKNSWQEELALNDEEFRLMEYAFLSALDALREGIHSRET